MELPHIGRQCSVVDCKQLDFLPFRCTCKLHFCRDHFYEHVEVCPDKKSYQSNPIESCGEVYVCSEDGCKKRDIVPLVCGKCGRHFCVTHRHVECELDVDAVLEARKRNDELRSEFDKVKANVDAQIDTALKSAQQKPKHAHTVNKIQLMKLKGRAKGQPAIPMSERVYFDVYHSGNTSKGTAVYVSREWTIGRAIDGIANQCKLPNNNNRPDAPKLRLCRKQDGQVLGQLSDKIKGLLEAKVIVDGQPLIMEYL